MAHLVTGYAGKEHIKSADQGSFNAAFFGDGEFVMSSGSRFAGAIINNNTVRISDGDMLMQGRHIRIEPNTYEDLTISTGTAGTNRIDLIVMTYEKNAASGIESAKLEVVQGTATSGTPSAPEIVSGDILNGDLKNQMPLYAVYVSGVALTKISTQFMVCPTYKDLAIYYAQQFQNACETHLNSLNIIDSADAIDANSAANQLAGIIAVIASVLKSNGGFMQAIDALARVEDAQATSTPGAFASFFGPDPFGLLCVVILTSLGTWGLPQMVQKFYAIKDEKSIGKGTLISTIFAIIVAGGCYFLGGFGRLYDIDIAAQGYDAIIPAMIEKLSPFLIAVVVILVLSASMSTLSSLVLASSSTLTLDMIRGTIVKEMTEKKQVFIMRIFIVVFIAISAVIAVVQYKSGVTFIAQLMGISWGALAGAFLAPFIYSLYWKGVTKAAVLVNFLFGSGIMVANMLARASFPTVLQSPINCGAFAMLAGLIIVPVVSLITPKLSDEKKQAVFSCYEK